MKKCNVNGQFMDVVTEGEFMKHPNLYMDGSTAVINPMDNLVYPVKNGKTLNTTGVYHRGSIIRYVEPEHPEKYSSEKIIDFDNAKNVNELIQMNNVYKDMERDILTTPDNLYKPKIGPEDSMETIALKEAICDKNMDITKYKPRFGPQNYANDKKAIEAPRTALPKLVRICNNLDIKVEIVLSNMSDDVPNPMSKEIRVELTRGSSEEE